LGGERDGEEEIEHHLRLLRLCLRFSLEFWWWWLDHHVPITTLHYIWKGH
jgi:hypothetical protein